MHPWRDIYSSADLKRIRSTWPKLPSLPSNTSLIKKIKNVLPANRIKIEPSDAIDQLERLIDSYHNIPKTDLNKFSNRVAALKIIGQTASDCFNSLTVACNNNNNNNNNIMQAYNHLNSITGNTECIQADKANDKEKNPLSILRSISRRAERKSDYLCKLQEYFSSNSNLSTTAGLLDYLSEDSTSENNALEVVKRNRLEITDPFHRNYEIEFNTDGKPEHKQANAISCAFAEWFDELGSGKNVPHFFIWLEGHDLCTANYRKICYDDNTNFKCSNTTNPKSVHQVNYSPNGLYAIKFKDGMVVYSKIGTNLSGLFDTSHVDDGKEKGAYAYVLTKAGDIIAAPHVGGKTHHSTLAMGKSVLCAGMIKAQQGKIVHVSNNSGHYQPPEANLREVVHILSVNNVFAQNAQIEVLSRSEPRLYSPSGFLSSKLKPRRSNQPVIRP